MIKALQSSGRAMAVQLQRHELIANNLANVNTTGFQRLVSRVRSVDPTAGDPAGSGARLLVESLTVSESGPMTATGNPKQLLAETQDPTLRLFLTRGEQT